MRLIPGLAVKLLRSKILLYGNGWLVGWLVGWLDGWLVGRLVGCLVTQFVCLSVSQSVSQSVWVAKVLYSSKTLPSSRVKLEAVSQVTTDVLPLKKIALLLC